MHLHIKVDPSNVLMGAVCIVVWCGCVGGVSAMKARTVWSGKEERCLEHAGIIEVER